MSGKEPYWVENRTGDDSMPACPDCGKIYADGAYFDIKNDQEGGGATIFFTCESCHEDAELIFKWNRLKGPENISDLLASVRELGKRVDADGEKIDELVQRAKGLQNRKLPTIKESKIIKDFLEEARAKKIKEAESGEQKEK